MEPDSSPPPNAWFFPAVTNNGIVQAVIAVQGTAYNGFKVEYAEGVYTVEEDPELFIWGTGDHPHGG